MKPLVIEDCPTGQCWEVTGRFRQRRCECGARRFAAEGGKCGVHATGYDTMGEEQKAHWHDVIVAEMRATRLLDHWRAIGLRRMGWRPIEELTATKRALLGKGKGGYEEFKLVNFSTVKLLESWLDANANGLSSWEWFLELPAFPRPVNEQADELRALLVEQERITKRLGETCLK